MDIIPVTAGRVAAVRTLFEEYWRSFGFTPCFQNFAAELASLPGVYSPPDGRLALALASEDPAGCIALRRFDGRRCEAKRLYVRPNLRGRGIGRALLEWAIAEARKIGYEELLGDTLPLMDAALRMYSRIGFEQIPPYSPRPTAGAIYMRLRL